MDKQLTDCCAGHAMNNFKIWYVPKKNILDKIYDLFGISNKKQPTYCQFCVDNCCVTNVCVCRLDNVDLNDNIYFCNCPYQNLHPCLVGIRCLECIVRGIGTFSCSDLDEKTCNMCNGPHVPHGTLCNGCSYLYKKCYECENDIQNGDHYISRFDEIVKDLKEEQIKDRTRINLIGPKWDGHYENLFKSYDGEHSRTKTLAGKTATEVADTIVNRTREILKK
ncbi:MAG: putative orfan [Satyrvirus sp.]|uniref:Putative orfan n=1 Tax=Satyrvirus sp. TaxID=2487771 RepID=A0A3G5AD63_9VIRU|nr:MAG: putative orfan [Satyrvirus sp.]